jgi:hypothetical protein
MIGALILIDRASPELLKFVIEESLRESGRRLPLHEVHRWWSRRFSAIYRFILASYLYDDEKLVRASIEKPELMREYSRGKVFFEPFAGGGTGLVEAALAGWDVYGIDINPIAVQVARASLMLVHNALYEKFEEHAVRVLDEAFKAVERLWVYNGSMVTVYVLISRGRMPTWISTITRKGKRLPLAMCPKCYEIFVPEHYKPGDIVICSRCGAEFSLTIKPVIPVPSSFPEISRGWRAFALELRDLETGYKIYISPDSQENVKWILDTVENAREIAQEACEVLHEEIETGMIEGTRLRKAGIRSLCDVFTPRQLASFKTYIEIVKAKVREDEKLLYAIALSEATKTCSLLAKWYPPTGEPVPAGGVKALWVPEYTVETNPLAHKPGSLKNYGRRVIASALKAQLQAQKYIKKHGGPHEGKGSIILGDSSSHNVPYPSHIDLAVIDPPYGPVKSYISLAITHYAGLRLFENVAGDKLIHTAKLSDIGSRELIACGKGSYNRMKIVFEKIALSMSENSRAILMYNSNSPTNWLLMLRAAVYSGLTPTAIYWVLGETPGNLTRSRIRGMYLIALRKGQDVSQPINIVFEDIISKVQSILAIDIEVERQTYVSLLQALNKVSG